MKKAEKALHEAHHTLTKMIGYVGTLEKNKEYIFNREEMNAIRVILAAIEDTIGL